MAASSVVFLSFCYSGASTATYWWISNYFHTHFFKNSDLLWLITHEGRSVSRHIFWNFNPPQCKAHLILANVLHNGALVFYINGYYYRFFQPFVHSDMASTKPHMWSYSTLVWISQTSSLPASGPTWPPPNHKYDMSKWSLYKAKCQALD